MFCSKCACVFLLGIVFLTGCSNKDSTKPAPEPSPYEKATSPEAVLRNLQVAYEAKDAVEYDSLLYDCGADTANAYSFWFAPEDVGGPTGFPESWGRAPETCAAAHMCESEHCGVTTLRLTFGGSWFDTTPGRQGQKIINVTDVYLTIDDTLSHITYLIQGQRSDFRFKVQWVDAEEDSLWRIIYWKDWASGSGKSAAVRPMTWGHLKTFFADGCFR